MVIDGHSEAQTEAYALRLVLAGLAGGGPPPDEKGDPGYQLREDMKTHAQGCLSLTKSPLHAAYRAQAWLMHAYSHWWRATIALGQMDAAEYDQQFPAGMSFRRYLGAWLWSVGVPQLAMTAVDIEAIQQATGVAACPHPALPIGRSEFVKGAMCSTAVEQIPARAMTAEAIQKAMDGGRL